MADAIGKVIGSMMSGPDYVRQCPTMDVINHTPDRGTGTPTLGHYTQKPKRFTFSGDKFRDAKLLVICWERRKRTRMQLLTPLAILIVIEISLHEHFTSSETCDPTRKNKSLHK